MTITCGTPTRCASGNHLHIPVTPNGQSTRTLTILQDDTSVDNAAEAEARLKARIISFLKESTGTLNARLAALAGKVFEI